MIKYIVKVNLIIDGGDYPMMSQQDVKELLYTSDGFTIEEVMHGEKPTMVVKLKHT